MEILIDVNVLLKLMQSHSILSQAEYHRNPTFNDEHYAAQAEIMLIDYLEKKYPKILDLYIKQESHNETE